MIDCLGSYMGSLFLLNLCSWSWWTDELDSRVFSCLWLKIYRISWQLQMGIQVLGSYWVWHENSPWNLSWVIDELVAFKEVGIFFFFLVIYLYSFLWGRKYTDRNWRISWPWIRKGDRLECWFLGEAQNQVEDLFAILMRCNGKRLRHWIIVQSSINFGNCPM